MAKAVVYSGNIWIWESSKAYRHEVEKVLARMLTTQAGKDLVRHIHSKSAQWMLISPFNPSKDDKMNAYASPRSAADAAPAGYVADTIEINIPMAGKIEVPILFGTGKGSRVDIIYHPATWHQLNKNMGHIAPGAGPGEIMFHEMVHGHREQCGLLRYRDQVASEPNMSSVEEFYAIAASNVYRSERGFTKLRSDHAGFKPLAANLMDPFTYYEHYKSYMETWFKEQKAYCLDLAKAPAKFNPFRVAAVEMKLMTGPAVPMRL